MPQWLTAILVEKVFKVILELIQKALEEAKAKKKAKEKVKEIMREKDPATRARRMSDFLQ